MPGARRLRAADRGPLHGLLRDRPPLGAAGLLERHLAGNGPIRRVEVVDGDREVGVVSRMVALPSCEALEVGDLLIPLVRDAIRSVDVAARRIDVDMGFLGDGP